MLDEKRDKERDLNYPGLGRSLQSNFAVKVRSN